MMMHPYLFEQRQRHVPMHPYPFDWKRYQPKAPGFGFQRFLSIFMFLALLAMIICLLVLGQTWLLSTLSAQHCTSSLVVAFSPGSLPANHSILLAR